MALSRLRKKRKSLPIKLQGEYHKAQQDYKENYRSMHCKDLRNKERRRCIASVHNTHYCLAATDCCHRKNGKRQNSKPDQYLADTPFGSNYTWYTGYSESYSEHPKSKANDPRFMSYMEHLHAGIAQGVQDNNDANSDYGDCYADVEDLDCDSD